MRAVLILRDVLRWRAAEVAELLGTTTAAVNGMLQRARMRLEQAAPDEDQTRYAARRASEATGHAEVSADRKRGGPLCAGWSGQC